MRVSRTCLLSTVGFFGVLTQFCNPAYSQEGSGIETITVTAEKRAEDVQRVPISMNVFEQKQLEDFDITDISSLQSSVPGMVVHTSPVNSAIYLRGFGSAPSNPVFDQSVSVYQDGIYFGLARQAMAPFFDVSRIEVLRGPQGALVGKNTAAGAISIITADPTSDFEGAVTSSYNFDLQGVETFGYVSGPLTDELSARVAVSFSNLDGYIRNTATGENDPRSGQALGRVTLKYQPTSNFNIKTKFEYGQDSTNGSSTVLISTTVQQTPPDTRDATDGFAVPPTNGEYSRHHGYNSATIANLQLGDFTFVSTTGFSGFNSDKNTFAAPLNPEHFDIRWTEAFDQQSEELQLLSPAGQTLEFIAGLYADHSNHSFGATERFDIFGGLFNGQERSAFEQSAYSGSAFATATWHVTDDFRLLGSARYTRIGKTGSFAFFDDFEYGLPGLLGTPHTVHQTISEDNFDPSITAQYDLNSDVMFYATYAKGSKGGGFDPANNSVTIADFAFKPEQSTNYEVGMKSNFLSNRLVLDVSAYILKFKNLQVSGYNPATNSLSTRNAAAATSKGIETTLAWQALDDLLFTGTGAFTYAAYDNFPGAQCKTTEGPTCSPKTNNIAGTVLQFVPRWSGDLQADYSRPVSNNLTFGATIAAMYKSSVWLDDGSYNPVIGRQTANTKFDARIQLSGPDDRWDIALIGKDLTDVRTRSYGYYWPLELGPGGAPVAVAIADVARTVAVQGTLHF